MELKHYENGRDLMHAVVRGEKIDRLPRQNVDYYQVMMMAEYPQNVPVGGSGVDPFGVGFVNAIDGFTPSKAPIDDILDWDQIPFPDPEDLPMEEEGKKILSQFDHDKMMLRLDVPYFHFERLHSVMGFENTLVAFVEEPEATHEVLAQLTDYYIRKMELVKKYYDCDIFVPHDDWGGNLNMFFSPETWREFIKPELIKCVNACHDLGMYFEQHTCGHIQEIIPDLCEIGVDILQPLMASCNDIPTVKREYGDKIVMAGACDTRSIVQLSASEEEVRTIARTSFESAGPWHFIPSTLVYGEGNEWKIPIVNEELEKYEKKVRAENAA